MREIKFRAWDNLNKYMWDVMQYLPYAGRIWTVKIQHNWGQSYMCDEFELLQFTGLLDKNGKEIYEGDILSTYPVLWNEKYNVQVKWIDWCWISNWMMWKFQAQNSEIIWNIYENPELLWNQSK